MAEYSEVQVDRVPMRIAHAFPGGVGPHPGVVVMFHRGGFDDFTIKVLDDLASAGFAATAPDVYHWPPVEEPPEKNPFPVDPEIIKDISATLEWMRGSGKVDMERLGITGHCMGGRMAFLGASTHPQFKACVPYYSGNMFKPWGDDSAPTPFDRLVDLKAEVLGFFGNDDGNPSPEDVDKIGAELDRLAIKHVFHRYDGAGHAFQNFLAPERFREAARDDSWAKTESFLKGIL